ncbi:MAG TPA: hypothetical protein VMV00_02540, partial [Candidatus Baltobacteraceae bacterium]|nr:hypothetical protein [Candidatus Baltobacteraceae bacterium]HVC58713.1 hypothetical protein [Candidatus Acidoferrales bacterium]
FLYVIFSMWQAFAISAGGAVSAVEAIALAIGLLSTIALFFTSLAGLGMDSTGMMNPMGDKALMGAALPLLIVAVATATSNAVMSIPVWAIIVGFIIGWIGTAMEKRM